ncbi:DUF4190 domain-containing protein [Pseudolysinimonas sp.]|uniref:DUF4190 domain-containing protein n=1 Tax=Pseudolysinimonas sp. TaxID=2680009 RepID=UPI003F81927E
MSCGMPTGVTAARPETKAIPVVVSAPEPIPEPVAALVADAAPAAVPTLVLAPPEEPPAPAPVSIRTRTESRSRAAGRRRVNALAIVALVLGCFASPLAALFGHLALSQLTAAGERGRIPAIIAIVLGYGSLAFIVGLGIIYLAGHA